jgi:dTDP-glucose pyrophosphorylase
MTTIGTGEFEGVILAAGQGARIRPFSDSYPKPLLPVLDRPLLVWQIEAMRALGIRDVLVVIGHLGHRIVQTLGDGKDFGVRLRYVEQQQRLGIAHAVGQLEPHVTRPFLLFLGDIFFETEDLSGMVDLFRREGVDGVLATKVEEDLDAIKRNFTVATDERGFVKRVIEKPRHPRTNVKGCGLYLFDATIFDAIRRTPRTALRDEYEITDSIQIFIEDGYGVVAAPVVQRDLNLSHPKDLLDLNLHVMRREGHDRFVAESAIIDPAARVERSVVMQGALLAAGVRLDECVVLPGETVPKGEYQRIVFASGHAVDCS